MTTAETVTLRVMNTINVLFLLLAMSCRNKKTQQSVEGTALLCTFGFLVLTTCLARCLGRDEVLNVRRDIECCGHAALAFGMFVGIAWHIGSQPVNRPFSTNPDGFSG